MGVIEIILTIISSILGCSTLIGFILYRRANKRIKDAEAEMAELDVDEKRSKSLHDSLDIVNEQLHNALKAGARKDEIIEDKTNRIRQKDDDILSLYDRLLKMERRMSSLTLFNEWLKNWHCRREWGDDEEDCKRRKPEQKLKERYNAPAEMEMNDEATSGTKLFDNEK